MEPVRIDFEYTPGDAVAAGMYVHATNPVGNRFQRRYMWGFVAAGVLAAAVGVAFVVAAPVRDPDVGYGIVLVGAVWAVMGLRFRGTVRAKVEKQLAAYYARPECGGKYGPMTVTASDDRVEFVTPQTDSRLDWPAITRAAVEDDYLFLVVHGEGVIPVPRNAFASDDRFERFAAAVLDRFRATRPPTED